MSIDVSRPWARVSSASAREAGGFFTLTNKATEPDRLIAAASPAAGKIGIHSIKITGPSMSMRPMEKGLGLPPDTAITLKPRGYHLLIQELAKPLAKGDRLTVTLTFEKAGPQQVELVVEDAGPINNATLMEGQPG